MFLILILIAQTYACNLLVLGGGGSHGAYQSGVIQYLIEQGMRWDSVKGYSVGSLNAAYLATTDPSNLVQSFNKTRQKWAELHDYDIYVPNLLFDQSIASSSPMRKTLQTIFSGRTKEYIPTAFASTNIRTGHTDLLKFSSLTDELVNRIMASMAIPIFFPPITVNGIEYWDGQLKDTNFIEDNLCSDPITSLTFISINYHEEMKDVGTANLIKLAVRAINLLTDIDSTGLVKRYVHNIPVILCEPTVDLKTLIIDFSKGKELWDLGYSRGHIDCKTMMFT